MRTELSIIRTLSDLGHISKNEKNIISLFIVTSTIIFVRVGNPVKLLVFAGAANGIILPIALAVILMAATKQSITKDYKHPVWMQVGGWLVVVAMTYMSVVGIQQSIQKL